MKSLKNAILEKLSIDDIKKSDCEFPINGAPDKIIEFLEQIGFENILVYDLKLMNRLKAPFYWYGGSDLYIGDTSKKPIHFETNSLLHMIFSNKKTRYGLVGPQNEENEFPWKERTVDKRNFLKALYAQFNL